MEYPKAIDHLIEQLRRLPSVGYKSAERMAFAVLDWDQSELEALALSICDLKQSVYYCESCGAMANESSCRFCQESRDSSTLCVVASAKDIFLFEQTGEYRGCYHVIGKIFSPIHRQVPSQKNIEALKKRILDGAVKEVILALDATLEGDATSLYIRRELQSLPITITRLAFGIPMGSSLDYVDGGTLARAFSGRRSL